MAINARINTTGTISRAVIKSSPKTAIAADSFAPKPNVSIDEVRGISTTGVENGFTLIFNSTTSNFEAQPTSNVAIDIRQITGGTF
jgi:hypothetical protein